MKVSYWLLVPLLLALTGCDQWDRFFLDDNGRPCTEEQELGWFIVNVFKIAFASPLQFLGCVAGVFLLVLFGGALWCKGGVWKIFGAVMMVTGVTLYCCFIGLVYLVLAIFFAVLIGGARRS